MYHNNNLNKKPSINTKVIVSNVISLKLQQFNIYKQNRCICLIVKQVHFPNLPTGNRRLCLGNEDSLRGSLNVGIS